MTYFVFFFFCQLVNAAFRAASLLSIFDRVLARALPPLRPPNRPRETAAGFLVECPRAGCSGGGSFADSFAVEPVGFLVVSLETVSSRIVAAGLLVVVNLFEVIAILCLNIRTGHLFVKRNRLSRWKCCRPSPLYLLCIGGGIYCIRSNPVFNNCPFISNRSLMGAGFFAYDASAVAVQQESDRLGFWLRRSFSNLVLTKGVPDYSVFHKLDMRSSSIVRTVI